MVFEDISTRRLNVTDQRIYGEKSDHMKNTKRQSFGKRKNIKFIFIQKTL